MAVPNPKYADNTDWKTSKGNTAPDSHLVSGELTADQVADIAAGIVASYPEVTIVRDATCTYNCHGYAHAVRHAWFNIVDQFLADDYEQFTPVNLRVDDRVVYTKGGVVQHSGIITQTDGVTAQKIRSKWGYLSEVVHSSTDVPATYGSITYYLRPVGTLSMAEQEAGKAKKIERINDILYRITSKQVMRLVGLASTPEALLASLRDIPEFTEIQLLGKDVVVALRAALARADDEGKLIPLFYAVGVLRNSELVADLAKYMPLLEEKEFSMNSEVLSWAVMQCVAPKDRRKLAVEFLTQRRPQ